MNATLRGFVKKELTQALRDKRMRLVIFLIPLFQLVVFGLALSNEVKNIRLKVYSSPGDTVATQIAERCFASGWFIPVSSDRRDPYTLIKKGQAEVVLIMPPGGLSKSLGRQAAQMQLLIDASNAIRARAVENYIRAISYTVISETFPEKPHLPVTVDARLLFNAAMKTPIYLVPGVMCMIICLITIILTSMSMAREKEIGTFEMLISAPVETWEILLGKTLPYVLLGLLNVPLILSVAIIGFDVPLRGGVLELAVAAFVFICTTVSVGTLISTFAKNQQQSMMGGFLFLFPAIQLSGVMAPLDNIPLLFKFFAYLNPLRYFVLLMRNIMLKGGEPTVVWANISAMTILCILAMSVTAYRFRKTLN